MDAINQGKGWGNEEAGAYCDLHCKTQEKEAGYMDRGHQGGQGENSRQGEASRSVAVETQVRDSSSQPKKARRRATARELHEKLDEQEFRCAISGDLLSPDTSEIAHCDPHSQSGGSAIDNLIWVSTAVNRCMGTMTPEQFIALCKRVSLWNS